MQLRLIIAYGLMLLLLIATGVIIRYVRDNSSKAKHRRSLAERYARSEGKLDQS